MSSRQKSTGAEGSAAKGGLPGGKSSPHVPAVDDLRRMYAVMALKKPVRLSDGRTGVITRVDTDFPANETTLHVWVEGGGGPGLAKVRADEVNEEGESQGTSAAG